MTKPLVSPSTNFRSMKGLALVLGVPLLVCALQPLQKKEIFRQDAGADVLVSRAAPADFMFPSELAYVEQAPGGGDIVTNGRGVKVRGPVTVAGSATSGSSGDCQLVVWDEYSGEVEHGGSFDVLGAVVRSGVVGEPFVIAGGPGFQGRPSVPENASVDGVGDGPFLVAWEEGPDGWGGPYRSVDQQWNNVTDTKGPLHSWRAIKMAVVTEQGSVTGIDVPMPSFAVQRSELNRRPGTERVGVFYERPVLWNGPAGVTWLAYRHVHQRESSLAIPKLSTHVERGFSIYLAKFEWDTQVDLYRIDERQRNGEQRLAFVRGKGGFQIAFETGRADRRKDAQFKGIRLVDVPKVPEIQLPPADVWWANAAGEPATEAPAPILADAPDLRVPKRPVTDVNGARFTLLFGDLHRHTDLSLCFPFFDGSIDDAYRYARGPGALDFIGLTDHARDLGQGNSASRPWQAHVAAADRHHRPGHFATFRAYERSQGDTDHNVIGLRPDADFLRPHRPPLTKFWSEFSPARLLTIPHATAGKPGARFSGDVWEKRDDLMRPIAEIYQGCRDVSSMQELRANALGTGQKLGFIASSDHLSTSSAYACAWAAGEEADALDRAPIFSALQARRCYGATARIELKVTAQHTPESETLWMGADLPAAETYTIKIEANGTAPIDRAEIWTAKHLHSRLPGGGERGFSSTLAWSPEPGKPDYLFVSIVQTDGERAWSSPFFASWDSVAPSRGR